MKTLVYAIIGGFINLVGVFSKSIAAKIALRLFTTPMKGFINKDQAEFLDTAFKEEFNYQDYTLLTYRWPNKGKTVLLVHGWESNSARWESLILRLKKLNYNIIALDAPAHGKSGGKRFTAILYAEFINVIINRFNPNIIIGHSAGAMASTFAIQKYNHTRVGKIVMIGSPSEFYDILDRYTKMLFINKRVAKAIIDLIVQRYNKHPKELSTANIVKNITISSLIFHDKYDDVIPYKDALDIKSQMQNSKLITTERLGHSLDEDLVYQQIEAFIAD